ncbi:MAG: hydrogenase maturation protease [Candidatus Binatia bacterium]|nr:hydrogenase maturation protease [Candidatus Binatia bacterium]
MPPGTSPPRILILGIGNAYRSDDAVGLIVARRLRHELSDVAEVREVSGEGTALLELWTGADAVIVIDAIQSGSAPGTVHRFDARSQPIPAASVRSSTHAFGVAEAVALARTLQQFPSRLVVYGIEGKNFAPGVGLSPEVDRSVEELVARVRQEVTNWYRGG